jgi:general secretion pathway protein G
VSWYCVRTFNKGFTRFEWVVSVTLYLLLTLGLLYFFSYHEELGESTAVSLTLRNMRSGLRYRMAAMAIKQGVEDYRPLLGENPVNWLEKPPDGYVGERYGEVVAAERGIWYFDLQTRQLVYRPHHQRYLQGNGGKSERTELRFRVLGQTHAGTIAWPERPELPVEGVRLEPTAAYSWF